MKYYLASYVSDYIGTRCYTPITVEVNKGDRFEVTTYARYSDPYKPRGVFKTGSRIYTADFVTEESFILASPASGSMPYDNIKIFEGEHTAGLNGGVWLGKIYWRMKRV